MIAVFHRHGNYMSWRSHVVAAQTSVCPLYARALQRRYGVGIALSESRRGAGKACQRLFGVLESTTRRSPRSLVKWKAAARGV